MDLNIDSLVIEVTRKCNLKCEHCLRGATQRKTISDQHIYKMMQLIDNVSSLTISGGEPTLAMAALDQIRNCTTYGTCDINSFYMVTNGKAINVAGVAAWAAAMEEACSDNEISGIGFSFDQWHTQYLNWSQLKKQERNYYELKETLNEDYGIGECESGGDFVRKHSTKSWSYSSLISEGRAKNSGSRDNIMYSFEEEEYGDRLSFSEKSLYLSSNGNIVAGSNWSYHSIDTKKDIRIAHIDDINCTDDLVAAIREYNKRVVANFATEMQKT